jgi:AraC family transcriptional regulator
VVLRGGFRERIGTHDTSLTTGALRVSPAARHHIDFGPSGATCLLIELQDADVARSVLDSFRQSAIFHDRSLSHLAHEMAAELGAFCLVTPLIIECLVAELVAQIVRRARPRAAPIPPAWLRDARDHLIESRHPVSLRGLARERGVHVVHLARAFRQHFGLTVGDFVRRQRLMAAYRLMGQVDKSLSLIAHEAGFADQSHLTREFKQAFGTTPGYWRDQMTATK